MSEQLNISNDDLNKIYTYLSQNNHTSMTKLSEYFSHDEDYRTLFRQR